MFNLVPCSLHALWLATGVKAASRNFGIIAVLWKSGQITQHWGTLSCMTASWLNLVIFFWLHPDYIKGFEKQFIWANLVFRFQGTIPFCLHVDGAEFYSNSEYLCWSLCSALATDHVLDTKFPLVVLPHQNMLTDSVKREVHSVVSKVMSWSLKCAALGVHPTTGAFGEQLSGHRLQMQGQSLPGGWRGVYFGFRSDEKARKETHGFPRSYQHGNICMNCMAQRPHKNWFPELSYKNFSKGAAHRLAQMSSLLSCFNHCFCFYILQSAQWIYLHTYTYTDAHMHKNAKINKQTNK